MQVDQTDAGKSTRECYYNFSENWNIPIHDATLQLNAFWKLLDLLGVFLKKTPNMAVF